MVDKGGAFNIWKIIKGDWEKIQNNTIAWIVIIGLTIVPPLYAWFNIAASWDPYSNTGNLKVAVASLDEGYDGELTSLNINVGEKVIAALRENDSLNWVFTDEEDAVNGVKDGSYYAALVIPESFSQDMMSFFTSDVHRSELVYYLNEKENAIAPKITDKGASGVKNQIDEVFAKTITEIALDIASSISSIASQGDVNQYMDAFLTNFETVGETVSEDAALLDGLAVLTDSLADVAMTASDLGADAVANAGKAQELIGETSTEVTNTKNELEKLGQKITSTLKEIGSAYDDAIAKIDAITAQLSSDGVTVDAVVTDLEELKTDLDTMTGTLKTVSENIQKLYDAIPEDQTDIRTKVGELKTQLDDVISKMEKASAMIPDAIEKIRTAESVAKEVRSICDTLREEIDVINTKYTTEIEPAIEELSASMIETNTALSDVFDKIDGLTATLESEGASAAESLKDTASALEDAASAMRESGEEIQNTASDLRAALNSGETEKIKEILGSNITTISEFVSAPVELDKTTVYPVANYGSGMAPFYTVLSIWVGAIVLAAMPKVNLTEERKRELEDLRDYQVYLGRMFLFLVVALLQSGLVCLGDLYFLEIQCEHPMMFLFAGWFTGIVFAIIMYTLTISFGDVGKAIAVILLVIQVAGSGGTFPIEMTPQFFQDLSSLMPFTYAMTAMRECIGGLYGDTYIVSLGYLAIYAVVFLLQGILLRKPIIKLNEFFMEKLESTKLY